MGTLEEINERLLKNKVPYWRELMEHSTYDAFWQARDVRPHLKNVRPAVLTVGGWFDAEDLFGTLETYKRNEKQSPNGVNLLVMGPWSHGQWASGRGERLGDVEFHQATGEYYREQIEFPFFERYLRGGSPAKPLAEAHVFETGANQWRTFDSWPPRQTVEKSYHLSHDGRLAGNPPSRGGYEEYVADPARPVPFVGYIANTMTVEHMLDDQRFAATRPDVLVFQTDPLEEDVTLAGPLEATLHISSTGTDADFVVKLIDVYPNDYPNPEPNPKGLKMGGFQQLVRGEPFRAKFRKSFEKPEPLVPGQVDKLSYTLPDVFHTFRRGHRMMVQVQSSWFPLVDRNPQKFMDIPKAKRSDFVKATQRVYVGPVAGSSLKVRVLSARPEATLR
jgi:putative CocE/NonD family hydrolase